MINHQSIHGFKVGDTVHSHYLLKSIQDKQTKTNKPYVQIVLQDQSGTIQANIWNTTSTDIPLQAGELAYVEALVSDYRQTITLTNLQLKPQQDPNLQPSLFREAIPEPATQLADELLTYVNQITNSVWRQIVQTILGDTWEAFLVAPAAKANHHALESGLLYHTVSMLRLATSISAQYGSLNRELLYAGIVLHDLAKTIELSGTTDIQYTDRGLLIGHISLIDQKIAITAHTLAIPDDDPSLILLHHMVLSHHGRQEYGSPVTPHIREAEVLHFIDMLDAHIMMMDTALAKINPGEWTPSLFAMDGRKFYRSIDPQN